MFENVTHGIGCSAPETIGGDVRNESRIPSKGRSGITNDELIAHAADVLRPHTTVDGCLLGDVAATLLTNRGNVYSGVCIDTGSGTGFCAEHAAIAAMVTAGEYRIARIAAVWRDEQTGRLSVLPPCGRCREFIRQIDPANLETEVVLSRETVRPLSDLLPLHAWPEPLSQTDEAERP